MNDEVGPDDEGALQYPPPDKDDARSSSRATETVEGPDESLETAAEIAAAADLAESDVAHGVRREASGATADQEAGTTAGPAQDSVPDGTTAPGATTTGPITGPTTGPTTGPPVDGTADRTTPETGTTDVPKPNDVPNRNGGSGPDDVPQPTDETPDETQTETPDVPTQPRSIPGQRERVLLSAVPDLPELTPRKSAPRRAQPHQLSTYTYRNELPYFDLETRLADDAVCQAALDLAEAPEDESVRQALLDSLTGDSRGPAESRTLLQVTALRGSGGAVAEFLDGLVLMRDLNARAFGSAPAPVPGLIGTSPPGSRPVRTDNVYAVTPNRASRDLLSGVPGFTRALANWAMISDDADRPDLEAAFQRAVANMPMELLDAIRHAIKLAPPLPGVPLRVDRLTGVVTVLPEEQATEVPGEGWPSEWRRSERRAQN